MKPQPVSVVSSEELALLTARPSTRIAFICVLITVAGVVQGVREGWSADALVLIGGAVASVLGNILFSQALMEKDRSLRGAAYALAGFAPYVFGCYLLFMRGLWGARPLLETFSVGQLAVSLAFAYFGYRIVYWTWRLTETADALRTGKLILKPGAASAA